MMHGPQNGAINCFGYGGYIYIYNNYIYLDTYKSLVIFSD